MAFQQNAFQHNAFQVQVVGGAAATATPLRQMMGYGLSIRLLAASQLQKDISRRQLGKTIVALLIPWKK